MTKTNTNQNQNPVSWGSPGNGQRPWTAAEKRELATARLLNSETPANFAPLAPEPSLQRLRLAA